MMNIPQSFAEKIILMRGEAGEAWLKTLPETIHICQEYWNLKISNPFNLSFNYVVAEEGDEFVMKICLPGPDFNAELNTLQLYDGRGLCRLIDVNENQNALLLERLRPGLDIKTIGENASLTAACSVIREMREVNP